MVNIAVFVSGGGTNLQSLIDACANNEINGSIKLVISNRKKAYGLERARLAGIKAEWIKDEDIIIKRLEEEQIDLIVLAGYLAIVSEKLISKYENKIINIHPSLIPSFCGEGYYGIHVHEACFKRGCKVSGATVHFVSAVVDGGPIILQRSIDISDCATPEEIQEKILINIEHKILKEAVGLYCDNKLKVVNERVEII
ncbi:MAG: phosphoribosylglycinamide formyltransferase [Erysipelotrichaceae bacterium]|nr:phosphoribosylglycinamide formyltransferase [Erysipelotrichaceae bacterium]